MTEVINLSLGLECMFDQNITSLSSLNGRELGDTMMKRSKDIIMETDIAEDMRLRGVISNIDGAAVIKVPAIRLPENFGFMLAHPCACVAPTKLEDYKIHEDPPGISGSLVEGRICYDAFLLDNKVKAIYYQEQAPATK